MEKGFVSIRREAFPAGLRVLVVDDDPTWLKIIEKMLKKCSFEATICSLATDALDILRKRKDGFDIVISDVNMPDMDGFKLLEQVGLEMNLPVIMMSVDGETTKVMKGVLHGACDYLLKPIRMKELQNIWQHVFRKKIHEVKDIESQEGHEDIQKMRNRFDALDDNNLLFGADIASPKKRKDLENHTLDDHEHDLFDFSASKKARVVWSVDLHQKFVSAVNQIGLDKVGPKKILDLMNVPGLKRDHVASHLQKYRLYLSRLQRPNEPQPNFGAKTQPDFNSKDPPANVGLQSSNVMNQNNAASCSFGYSSSKMPVQDVNTETDDDIVDDLVSVFPVKEHKKVVPSHDIAKDIVSFLPVKEPKKASSDVPYFEKMGNDSRMGVVNPFESGTDVTHTSFQSTVSQQHTWGKEIPIQFTEPKEAQKLHRYTDLCLPVPDHDIQADCLQLASSVNLGTSITEIDEGNPFEFSPLCTENTSNHDRYISQTKHRSDSVSVLAETNIVNTEVLGASPNNIRSPEMKSDSYDRYSASNREFQHQNYIPGSGLTSVSSHGDLQLFSLDGSFENVASVSSHGDLQLYSLDGSFENVALSNLELLDHFDPELITELLITYMME